MRIRKRAVPERQWERRVLEYAKYLASEALSASLFDGFLGMLAADFPGSISLLDYDPDGRLRELGSWHYDTSDIRAYTEHFHALNPFTHAIVDGALFERTANYSLAIDQQQLLRSEYFNDFMRPRGERYMAGIALRFPDGGRSGLPIYRGEAEGEFTSEEIRRLDMIRPFLKNALHLRRLYFAAPAPERMSIPNVIATAKPVAEDQAMRIAELKDHRSLLQSIDGIENVFHRRHGLTRRESQVAALLCEGLAYKEVARVLGVSYSTVNTHVKSILRKLDANSIRHLPLLLHRVP